MEFTSSTVSYWPLVFNQSKRIEIDIEKVQLLTLCNLLKIEEEDEEELRKS